GLNGSLGRCQTCPAVLDETSLSLVGVQLRPGLTRKRGGLVRATGSRTTTSVFSRRSTAFIACSAESPAASARDSSLTPLCSNSVLLSTSQLVIRAAFASISALSRCDIVTPLTPNPPGASQANFQSIYHENGRRQKGCRRSGRLVGTNGARVSRKR